MSPGRGDHGTPDGFVHFRPRAGRINWRYLHTLDDEQVVRTGDTETLLKIQDNLMFARFGEEDLQIASDLEIRKMVRLSQLCMEHLYVQNTKLQAKAEDAEAADDAKRKEIYRLETSVRRLQKEVKDRRRQVTLYESLLRERKENVPPGIGDESTNKTLVEIDVSANVSDAAAGFVLRDDQVSQPPKTSRGSPVEAGANGSKTAAAKASSPQFVRCGSVFQCPYCVKKFETVEYLERHILRRHADQPALSAADLQGCEVLRGRAGGSPQQSRADELRREVLAETKNLIDEKLRRLMQLTTSTGAATSGGALPDNDMPGDDLPEDVASELFKVLKERNVGVRQSMEVERRVADLLSVERERVKADLRAELQLPGGAAGTRDRERLQKLDEMMDVALSENRRLADTVQQLQSRNQIHEMRLEEMAKGGAVGSRGSSPQRGLQNYVPSDLLASLHPLQRSSILPPTNPPSTDLSNDTNRFGTAVPGTRIGSATATASNSSNTAPPTIINGLECRSSERSSLLHERERALQDLSQNATRMSEIAAEEERIARQQEMAAARLAVARDQRLRAEFLAEIDDSDAQYIQAPRRMSAYSSLDLDGGATGRSGDGTSTSPVKARSAAGAAGGAGAFSAASRSGGQSPGSFARIFANPVPQTSVRSSGPTLDATLLVTNPADQPAEHRITKSSASSAGTKTSSLITNSRAHRAFSDSLQSVNPLENTRIEVGGESRGPGASGLDHSTQTLLPVGASASMLAETLLEPHSDKRIGVGGGGTTDDDAATTKSVSSQQTSFLQAAPADGPRDQRCAPPPVVNISTVEPLAQTLLATQLAATRDESSVPSLAEGVRKSSNDNAAAADKNDASPSKASRLIDHVAAANSPRRDPPPDAFLPSASNLVTRDAEQGRIADLGVSSASTLLETKRHESTEQQNLTQSSRESVHSDITQLLTNTRLEEVDSTVIAGVNTSVTSTTSGVEKTNTTLLQSTDALETTQIVPTRIKQFEELASRRSGVGDSMELASATALDRTVLRSSSGGTGFTKAPAADSDALSTTVLDAAAMDKTRIGERSGSGAVTATSATTELDATKLADADNLDNTKLGQTIFLDGTRTEDVNATRLEDLTKPTTGSSTSSSAVVEKTIAGPELAASSSSRSDTSPMQLQDKAHLDRTRIGEPTSRLPTSSKESALKDSVASTAWNVSTIFPVDGTILPDIDFDSSRIKDEGSPSPEAGAAAEERSKPRTTAEAELDVKPADLTMDVKPADLTMDAGASSQPEAKREPPPPPKLKSPARGRAPDSKDESSDYSDDEFEIEVDDESPSPKAGSAKKSATDAAVDDEIATLLQEREESAAQNLQQTQLDVTTRSITGTRITLPGGGRERDAAGPLDATILSSSKAGRSSSSASALPVATASASSSARPAPADSEAEADTLIAEEIRRESIDATLIRPVNTGDGTTNSSPEDSLPGTSAARVEVAGGAGKYDHDGKRDLTDLAMSDIEDDDLEDILNFK